jgi:hypothetical protein
MKPGCWAGFKKVHTAARKEVGRTNTLWRHRECRYSCQYILTFTMSCTKATSVNIFTLNLDETPLWAPFDLSLWDSTTETVKTISGHFKGMFDNTDQLSLTKLASAWVSVWSTRNNEIFESSLMSYQMW